MIDLPTSDVHRMAMQELDTTKLLAHASMQRDQYRLNDFLIVDSDCHHYENESISEIIEFIEDPVLKHSALMSSAGGTGTLTSLLPSNVGYQDVSGRITRYPLRKSERTDGTGAKRDVQLTRRWMDAIGVDYACLFPTPMLMLPMHPQVEVEAQFSRAYNLWLTEKVLPAEPRLRTMVYLPFNDPDATYRTVRDFGDRKGVIGFMVVSARYKPVYDNAYMKSYALMEEMGKPLAFHASYYWGDQMLANTNRFVVTHALGFTFYNALACANWVANGLPVRFPRLKLVWIESGLAWVPWLMQRLDNDYKMRSSDCPALKAPPSEYMRQMFYTSQPLEVPDDLRILETTFRMINAETQLLWASDYPHWDMDLPGKIYALPFLSEQTKRNILGENARRLFKLDVSDWEKERPGAPIGTASVKQAAGST